MLSEDPCDSCQNKGDNRKAGCPALIPASMRRFPPHKEAPPTTTQDPYPTGEDSRKTPEEIDFATDGETGTEKPSQDGTERLHETGLPLQGAFFNSHRHTRTIRQRYCPCRPLICNASRLSSDSAGMHFAGIESRSLE